MGELESHEWDDGAVSFLGHPAPHAVVVRAVSVPAGAELAFDPGEWRNALVIVEAGEIELVCDSGARQRFGIGSVLFFGVRGLRLARNPGNETAVLSAVWRRDDDPKRPTV